MPKKYIKRTSSSDRGQWTEDILKEALAAIETGNMGVNQAAKHYSIPCRTLRRRKKRGMFRKLPLGFPGVFTSQNEQLLVKHVLRLLKEGYPVNRHAVRTIAYRFAEDLNLNHRFNKMTKTAGLDWLNMFLRRNKDIRLVPRELGVLAEPYPSDMFDFKKTETLNSIGNKESFDFLSKIYQDLNLHHKPQNIFIFSETSCFIREGVDKDDKDTVTLLASFNAAGTFLPPVVIFRGVRVRAEFCQGLPEDSQVYLNNQSATLNSQLLTEWLREHFIPRKPEGKCVIFFEGHPSYLDCAEMLRVAEQNQVVILSFQILTCHFFKIFGFCYEEARLHYCRSNDLPAITPETIGEVIRKAWDKAATKTTALAEFSDFGIFPLSESALPDRCYELFDGSFRNENAGKEYSDDSSVEEIENDSDSDNHQENFPEVKIEDVDVQEDVEEIKEDSPNDEEIRNNYSIFATEPIFESILINEAINNDDFEPQEDKLSYPESSVDGENDFCEEGTQTYKPMRLPCAQGKIKATQSDLYLVTHSYKTCFVPECTNTSLSNFKKVFVKVQLNNIIYKKWAEKFGQESFHSPYVFCEDHFDMSQDTARKLNIRKNSNEKFTVTLKPTAVPKTHPNFEAMISSIVITAVGPVTCIRPKVSYNVETSLNGQVKNEVYEMKNKFVCDSEIQCDLELGKDDKTTQINIVDTSTKIFYCSLPSCPSTSVDMPKKRFFSAPDDERMKMKWSESLGVGVHKWMMSHSPTVHCCEDHFHELDKVDDWERYKSEGCKIIVNLNEGRRRSSKAPSKKPRLS